MMRPPSRCTLFPYTTLFRFISKDGKTAAYGISVGGSDWNEFHLLDVATRKPLPDIIKWNSFQSRSEEHTSELQSHSDLVCRHLLEKTKQQFSVRRVRRQIDS